MLNKILRYSIGSDLVIYIFRCCIGFGIGYELYTHFENPQLYWVLLSIVLVISPEAKDSKKIAIERFKANLIGSGIGLLCYFIGTPDRFIIAVGIILTISVCYFFNLMEVVRTAVVAIIIVMIHEQDSLSWTAAVEHLGVAIGCVIGLLVTVITSFGINFLRKKLNIISIENRTNNTLSNE